MRRFVTLAILLLFTVPFGVSISGCSKKSPTIYCNGADSGIPVGQVTNIDLEPKITGISLNFSQIGQVNSPTATDCKSTTESVSKYTYATFLANGTPDITIADVQPTTGKLCAGTWNRNTGGGIPDFTTCNPTNKSGTVFVVASAEGASSNPLPIYVHPVVTSVVLGPLSTDCLNDPATNCSPAAFATQQVSCTVDPGTGCCTVPVTTQNAVPLTSCASQGTTGQLAARVYQNASQTPANDISCKVGHLSYAAQATSVVTIDQNGVATAQQPGSTVITANISNAGSSAGFFSTCPPASISLTVPGITGPGPNSVVVNPNNTQPITALTLDTNGVVLTGLSLEFESTTPTTIPAASGSVTPPFPGAAAITAICQPPSCNPSPFNQIGLFGNGKAVTSNPVTVIAPGINSTNLYIASTNSLYLVPVDFTQPQIGAPVRLPFQPNSMVISNDGSSIYMGSSFEIMTFSAISNTLSGQDTSVTGTVLAVSPDGSTLVITDPIRQFIYLYSANGTGGIQTQYGGVATHAAFSPDSQTVYITEGDYNASTGVITPNNQLLIHSQFTGWYQTTSSQATTDVAFAVPSVGAFFAGNPTTARSYCPVTTVSSGQETTSSTTTNVFYPDAGVMGPTTDLVATTNDGYHILGATVNALTDLVNGPLVSPNMVQADGLPIGGCPQIPPGMTSTPPVTFDSNMVFTGTLPGVTATAITGVFPTSDSATAFVTYTGTGGVLPAYTPALPQPSSTPGLPPTIGPGTLTSIPLSTAIGTPIAPIVGVVSADNQTFFAGTSGDNAVHLITKQTDGSYKDVTTPIAPKLPDVNGNIVVPNLLVQKPRKATS